MCTILFAWQQDAKQPLLVAANRDEFHGRPTAPAAWHGDIFSGLDLLAGGTWIGFHKNGRFAGVTNFREPALQRGNKSRGELTMNFLNSELSPADYCANIQQEQMEYGPFNLLVSDGNTLYYMSNRGAEPQPLAPGVYGLSNGLLNSPWPKVINGKQALVDNLHASDDEIIELLKNTTQPCDEELPDTGVAQELERRVAPLFIQSPEYGTRCSTVMRLNHEGDWRMVEQSWTPEGTPSGARRYS